MSRRCRSNGFQWLHGPSKAARAAATARSTSAAVPAANSVRTEPSAGLIVGRVRPSAASTHWPPMSMRFGAPSRKPGVGGAAGVSVVVTKVVLLDRYVGRPSRDARLAFHPERVHEPRDHPVEARDQDRLHELRGVVPAG